MRALWEVDGRALRRPLIGVAGVAATISLGEFGATTVLTRSGRTETLPIAIGRLLGRAGDLPRLQSFALSTILAVICATIVMVSSVLARRGPEAR
jgi:thiamine transport system permease protein